MPQPPVMDNNAASSDQPLVAHQNQDLPPPQQQPAVNAVVANAAPANAAPVNAAQNQPQPAQAAVLPPPYDLEIIGEFFMRFGSTSANLKDSGGDFLFDTDGGAKQSMDALETLSALGIFASQNDAVVSSRNALGMLVPRTVKAVYLTVDNLIDLSTTLHQQENVLSRPGQRAAGSQAPAASKPVSASSAASDDQKMLHERNNIGAVQQENAVVVDEPLIPRGVVPHYDYLTKHFNASLLETDGVTAIFYFDNKHDSKEAFVDIHMKFYKQLDLSINSGIHLRLDLAPERLTVSALAWLLLQEWALNAIGQAPHQAEPALAPAAAVPVPPVAATAPAVLPGQFNKHIQQAPPLLPAASAPTGLAGFMITICVEPGLPGPTLSYAIFDTPANATAAVNVMITEGVFAADQKQEKIKSIQYNANMGGHGLEFNETELSIAEALDLMVPQKQAANLGRPY